MVGQVLPLLLWFYLQPILFSRLFLFPLPGRDTQDFIADAATSFISEDLSSLASYFSTFAWSLFQWIFLTGRVWLLIAVMPVVLLIQSHLPDGVSRFTKKHGQWKHRSLFPKTFLLLSAVALPHSKLCLSWHFNQGEYGTNSYALYKPSPIHHL